MKGEIQTYTSTETYKSGRTYHQHRGWSKPRFDNVLLVRNISTVFCLLKPGIEKLNNVLLVKTRIVN